ncbi:hypothetical protein KP509_24G027400 [Ceratopteris richardii]|uniref:Uncharacterized protein n=1 Tax=Ceratopteris richardii TaxID=49495 RepID=A0A8T2RVV3_CERRI|nr:hypothetical protein KP509_24G027400 [Ceratopteris richardii]
MKPSILALFRKFSAKDLLKSAQTRFAYMFIMLYNLLNERVYNGFRSMVVSLEYTRKKVSRTQKAEDVSSIVLSASFLRSAREIVNVCAPFLHVLCLADREGATMGFIYELTNRMIEKIGKLDGIDNVRLKEVKALCIEVEYATFSPSC